MSVLGNVALGFSKVSQAASNSAKFMQSATGASTVLGLEAKSGAVGLAQLGIYGGLAAGAIGLIYLATQNATTGLNEMQRAEKATQGAVDSMTGALNRSKSATETATDDQHLAALALTQAKDAQHAVTEAIKQYGPKSRQARDATAAAKVAWDGYRHAADQARTSTTKAQHAQAAQRKQTNEVAASVRRLTAATHSQIGADEKSQNARAGNVNRTKDYQKGLQALIGSIDSEIGKLKGAFPTQAANLQHLRDQARAALDLSQQIQNIPSQKRINIDIITNRYTGATSGPPTGGAPGDPHGGTSGHPAIGGPVIAGHRYMVGERGPEEFVPQSSGRIVPNGRMDGSFTLRIIDWEKGLAQVRGIARDEIDGATRRRGQFQRMGA
jgi:soluble cytochrome b562